MATERLEKTAPSPVSHGTTNDDCEPTICWVWPNPLKCTPLPADSAMTLGRESCDQQLPGSEVSKRHARIEPVGAHHVIADLGSTNGLFLNGTRVASATLAYGDVVRIGDWVGIFTLESRTIQRDDTNKHPSASSTPRSSRFFREEGMLVGPSLAPAIDLAKRAAASGLSVVIEGETGTGKELLAAAIHRWSKRCGPFLAVNCSAIPEALAEAELFGYRKGAFTGAHSGNVGLIRSANGGTLLLDELARLPLSIQAKLLRAIEQREVIPLGESRPVSIDVYLVSATQQPLDALVARGDFARDLQMRIEDVVVQLPPLRDRRRDLGFLLLELVKKHTGGRGLAMDPRLVEALCLYSWPGNLRELSSLVRTLVSLHGREPMLRRTHLPPRFNPSQTNPIFRLEPKDDSTSATAPRVLVPSGGGTPTRMQLEAVARECGGNLTRAASQIGVPRQLFYRQFSEIERVQFRQGAEYTEAQNLDTTVAACPSATATQGRQKVPAPSQLDSCKAQPFITPSGGDVEK